MSRKFFFYTLFFLVSSILFALDETSLWMQNNPNPSKRELLSFVMKRYHTFENIQDTYTFFYAILENYPPSLIHHSIYIHFAKAAILRYDFHSAAVLYYSAFEKTNDPYHLLLASIQEYQAGNIELTKRNIGLLQEQYDISNIIIPLIYLNTSIYIYEKNFKKAEDYLNAIIKKNKKMLLPASIYYVLYKIALKTDNKEVQKQARSILQNKYSRSFEYELINNTITALPIPSHFFSFLDSEIDGFDALPNTLSTSTSTLSSIPTLGYQVASFQNRTRADNYYYKLIQELEEARFSGTFPIMSKSIVENTTFYQIIIPLSESKNKQEQIRKLREIGIEGFLKHKE